MSPLSVLLGASRLPLLVWLAGQGRVTKAAIAREFPATREHELHRALRELAAAGWLQLERGPHKGTHHVQLAPAALDAAERLLEEALPGGWPAERADLDALAGELNLFRSKNRLAVLQAVRDGHETRTAIAAATGLTRPAVATALLELADRGHVAERTWRWWGEAVTDARFVYQPTASQARRLLADLRAGREGVAA